MAANAFVQFPHIYRRIHHLSDLSKHIHIPGMGEVKPEYRLCEFSKRSADLLRITNSWLHLSCPIFWPPSVCQPFNGEKLKKGNDT
jgi:hypothetical protein